MVAITRSLSILPLILCCALAAQARSLRSKVGGAIRDHRQPPSDLEVEVPGAKPGEGYKNTDEQGEEFDEGIDVSEPTTPPDISYLDNDTGVYSSVVFQFKERMKVMNARWIDYTTEDLSPFHTNGSSLQLCAVIRNRTALLEWLKKHADMDFPILDDPDPNDGVPPPKILPGGCNITENNVNWSKSLHVHLVDACLDPDVISECAVEYNLINDTFRALLDRSATQIVADLPDEFPVKPPIAVIRSLYVKAFTNNVPVPLMLNKMDIHNESAGPDGGFLINGSFANTGDGLAALQMLMDSPDPDVHAEFTVHGHVPINEDKYVEPDIMICAEDFYHPQTEGGGLQGLIDFLIMRGAPSVVRSMQLAEDSVKPGTCAERGFTIGPFLDHCVTDDSARFYLDSVSYSNWNKSMAADKLVNGIMAKNWQTMEGCLNWNGGSCDHLLHLEELVYPFQSLSGNKPACIWSEEQARVLDTVEETLDEQNLIREAQEEKRQQQRVIDERILDRKYRGLDDDGEEPPPDPAIGRPAEDPVIEVEEDPDFLDGLDPAS